MELNKLLDNRLYAPERCRECPVAANMRTQLDTQLQDIEQLGQRELFASPRTTRRVALARSGMTDPILQESQRAIEAAFSNHESFVHKCQLELARLANDCVGSAMLKETLPLGNTISVTVCGSAVLEASHVDEPVLVERHDSAPQQKDY